MRLHALYLNGALTAMAIPIAAGAATVEAQREAAISAAQAGAASYTCPPGYYWEPDALCATRQV
jgi:hypothetical protein